MDFSYTQEQQDLRALARRIFEDLAPVDTLPDFDIGQDWHDEKLWSALAEAQLLGVALPEDCGGAGMSVVELCLLFEEAGRVLAPVALLPTLAMGAAPIAAFASNEQKMRLLPAVVAGDLVMSAALMDESSRSPTNVVTTARRDGDDWRLDGIKAFVPAARRAGRILVTAKTDENAITAFVLDPSADGVTLEPQTTTTGENEYRMTLDGAAVAASEVLGNTDSGHRVLEFIIDHTIAALCATEVGLAERAVRMTAEYSAERKQFGRPIAAFQAVAQRAADAYIDVEAIRLAAMQAVWRLSRGLPARRELEIAKFWAAEGGHRACYAAQHLHGGIGVDTDYPLHHYYLRSHHIALSLGGANTQLASLGRRLAATSAVEATE